jgi:sugar lactone lactonase YvrE
MHNITYRVLPGILFALCGLVGFLPLDASAQNIITTIAGGGPSGGPALLTELPSPSSVAVDQFGNVYIAEMNLDEVFKLDKFGNLTVVAGIGFSGFSGDGGPATSAALNLSSIYIGTTQGIAFDSGGSLFISDMVNNRIRRVDASTGIITTVAGSGPPLYDSCAYSGDGGPATSASLCSPAGIAVDHSGNLFIADGNNVIRRVDGVSGIITTVVGNGAYGYSGDGGPATGTTLYSPEEVVIDTSGNLFVADSYNNVIRRVDGSTGIITTVVGDGPGGGADGLGDGGPATSAILSIPTALALDALGDLFIADSGNELVRRVDATTHIITAVAGNGSPGFSGDGGPATSANLNLFEGTISNFPASLAVDASGAIFIPDTANQRLRRVDGTTGIITTIAGGGSGGDGGPATSGIVAFPGGLAVDSSGNIFIPDSGTNRVRRLDAMTGIITTVAGNGFLGFSGDGGLATSAELNHPIDVAVDSSGNLFIADEWNSLIRRVDAAAGIITTVAGNGTQGYGGDRGPATSASLNIPRGVAVDSSGNLFIGDSQNYRVRKVDTTGTITTVAGNGTQGFSGDGGPAINAELGWPSGVTLDALGNLLIADSINHRIRRVDAVTGIITTVTGNGTPGYSGDGGPATSASLYNPRMVKLDIAGNLYISDVWNHRIRMIYAASGIITTLAGNGTAGFGGDGGPSTSAMLNYPYGVVLDNSGHLLIGDSSNNRVRRVVLTPALTLSPSSLTFGPQNVGTSSPSQTVTLSNTGSATLSVSSIEASGDFAQTNNCGSAVAAGGNCTISVTFTPTASGARAGSISIADNASGSPQSVSLSGTGTSTVSLVMGPQAMEGNLHLSPGTTLEAGYDFTMPGSHPGATVNFIGAEVTFAWKCVSGAGSGNLAVPMANQSYTDTQSSSAWYPSGVQSSSLVYQGSTSVPDVCSGGLVSFQAGGTFFTGIGSTDTNDKVNVRWHYSGNGSAGGWSGTQSVVP